MPVSFVSSEITDGAYRADHAGRAHCDGQEHECSVRKYLPDRIGKYCIADC
jgi:hypothetical protein